MTSKSGDITSIFYIDRAFPYILNDIDCLFCSAQKSVDPSRSSEDATSTALKETTVPCHSRPSTIYWWCKCEKLKKIIYLLLGPSLLYATYSYSIWLIPPVFDFVSYSGHMSHMSIKFSSLFMLVTLMIQIWNASCLYLPWLIFPVVVLIRSKDLDYIFLTPI